MDVLKLGATVRMLLAFHSLGVDLKTISHLMEKSGHFAVTDAIPVPLEFRRRYASAAHGPAQERLRVTPRHRLYQLPQGLEQIGMMKGERLRPPPALRIHPAATGFLLRCCNSRMPAWIVVRDRPVAWATSDTPPRGRELASVADQTRCPCSSRGSRSARYLFRTTANAVSIG